MYISKERKVKKVLKMIRATFDTETVGGACNPTGTYNYGVVFHDDNGEIIATQSILVMEHYDEIKNDNYAKKNFHLYEERMKKGEITCVATEEEAITILRNLLRRYNVKYIMAYNTGFDLVKTKCKELLNEFEFIDIWLMACETILCSRNYNKFCRENNYFSKSGKSYSSSAETVYRYITKDNDFIEEHTALNDALIEKVIFEKCYKTHKRYTRNAHKSEVLRFWAPHE